MAQFGTDSIHFFTFASTHAGEALKACNKSYTRYVDTECREQRSYQTVRMYMLVWIFIARQSQILLLHSRRVNVSYCAFDSIRKYVICLAFYFTWNWYVLTDHIVSETIYLFFTVSVFCWQICTLKLNLRPKMCLTYAISIVKWFFFKFLSKKISFTFLCWIWIIDVSQQYREIFRKIEQAKLVEKLPPSYLPFRFLHNLHSFLFWEKVKIFDFFLKKTND